MTNFITLIWAYGVFAFCNWDYNPANWEGWVRIFFFVVWIGWSALQYAMEKERILGK